MDIGNEGLKLIVVVENRFEKLEESLDDLHVGLTETFIKFDGLDTALNLGVITFRVFQIIKGKQDAFEFLELSNDQASRVLIH